MVGRSRTGCLTCRARKTKCDEQRPICGQCAKANRECTPSTGIVFRHQQNASMNQSENQEDDSLQSFYAYKNTFDKDNVWVKIPHRVSFIVNADPYAEADPDNPEATLSHQLEFPPHTFQHRGSATSENSNKLPGFDAIPNAPGIGEPQSLPPISAIAPSRSGRETSAQASDALKTLSSPVVQSPGSSTTSGFPPASNNLNYILNPSSAVSPPANAISDRTSSRYSRQSQDAEVETDHELIFLIRHFSETLGPWMDLFDLGLYFTNHVPVKVLTNPLLKNAAAAYAAKQLGRVRGRKSSMGGFGSRPAYSELYQDIDSVDWQNKAPYYYDKAINLLIQAIKDGQLGGQNDYLTSPFEAPHFRVADLGHRDHRGSFNSHSPSMTSGASFEKRKWRKASSGPFLSDEMAAATVILCDYEILGGSRDDWSRHLDGAKSLLSSSKSPFDKLFDIVEGSVMPLQAPCILPCHSISRARQATFWNFARQDFLWAFMKESQTRLDTEDIAMWRDAGLTIEEDGYVKSSNCTETGLPEGDCMKEDMISNALIWIMAKIVNFANSAAGSPMMDRSSSDSGMQALTRETWCRLERELDFWHKGLPDSFRPCAKTSSRDFPARLPDGRKPSIFSEIWYNIGMCASTMQSYSMARILLLLHQPSTTVGQAAIFKRFDAFKSITADILGHARNICGIAAARPQNGVRIHSVQPLFTAGQCLETLEERTEVIRLLRDIEHDTGWATEYRVQQLYSYWNPDNIKSEAS